MKRILLPMMLAVETLLAISVNAQNSEQQAIEDSKEPKQAINICAVAIPVMNLYVLNYEYLLNNRHGLAARLEFAPGLEGPDTEGTGWAFVFNYRWHFSPKLDGFFIGPYAKYSYTSGSGKAAETDYNFKAPMANIGLNGGYRWVSKIGINLVFAWGYGYSFGSETLSPSTDETKAAFEAFKNAESKNNMAPYYAEFSIGYAF